MGSVNDREFTTFLNRCVRYALADASSPKGVDIGAFISAVKGPRFNANQHDVWVQRLVDTHDAQRQMLVGMVHGIYCDPNTSEPSRLNALDIGSSLKEILLHLFAQILSTNIASMQQRRRATSCGISPIFEKLGLLTLLNESEQHAVFYRAIERLWNVHNGTNNFYNEPPFAERLLELSLHGAVPETAQEQFVQVVVCCNIGNGYGVCWAAATSYEQLIRNFSPREIATMIRLASNNDNSLGRRVNALPSCRARFKATLALIDPASIPSGVKAAYDHFIK